MKIEYKNPEKKQSIFIWEAEINFLSKEREFNLRNASEEEIKEIAQKRYGRDVHVFPSSQRQESFFLWISKIKEWESQKNIDAHYSIRESKEYEDKENKNTIALYDFSKNILGKKQLKVQFSTDIYQVAFDPGDWKTKEYDKSSPFYIRYTRGERYIGQTEDIVNLTNDITREGEGYLAKAKIIYNWIIKNITPQNTNTRRGAMRVLENGSGGTIEINFLLLAMLRAADIPARMISGVWGEIEKRQEFHFWTEFYIEGVGWIPVDCVKKMFGDMDNKRIILSKGENISLEMAPENDNFFNISYKRIFFLQPEAFYVSKKEEGFFAIKENKYILVKGQR